MFSVLIYFSYFRALTLIKDVEMLMGDNTSVKLSNCEDMDGETAFELLGMP